jgi:hypothetical protein
MATKDWFVRSTIPSSSGWELGKPVLREGLRNFIGSLAVDWARSHESSEVILHDNNV